MINLQSSDPVDLHPDDTVLIPASCTLGSIICLERLENQRVHVHPLGTREAAICPFPMYRVERVGQTEEVALKRIGSPEAPPPWADHLNSDQFASFLAVLELKLKEGEMSHKLHEETGQLILRRVQGDVSQDLSILTNACISAPRPRWPAIISQALDVLQSGAMQMQGASGFDMSWEEARTSLRTAIYPKSRFADVPEDLYIFRALTDDLRLVLTLNLDRGVGIVRPSMLTRWGVSLEEAFQEGMTQTGAQETYEASFLETSPGTHLMCFAGDTIFTASHVLFLRQHLENSAGHGALISMPSSQMLLIHEIQDHRANSAFQGMQETVAKVARMTSLLSPHVYWWRPGHALTPLTRWSEKQTVEPHLPEEFQKILSATTALS